MAGAIRVSNLYEMRAPGSWVVSTSVTAITKQALGRCGFVQSEAMTVPSGWSLWRAVPGAKPKEGYDWSAGADITGFSTSQLILAADVIDPAKPPTWSVDWLRDNTGGNVLGFAQGYFPDKTGGAWSARSGNPVAWDLRSTKKNYPNAVETRTLNPGERVSVQAFRTYLPPSDAAGFAVQDAQAGYGFTLATGATAKPVPLPTQVGRTITTLGAHGLTVAPGAVDADGLLVTGTGSAVTKLT